MNELKATYLSADFPENGYWIESTSYPAIIAYLYFSVSITILILLLVFSSTGYTVDVLVWLSYFGVFIAPIPSMIYMINDSLVEIGFFQDGVSIKTKKSNLFESYDSIQWTDTCFVIEGKEINMYVNNRAMTEQFPYDEVYDRLLPNVQKDNKVARILLNTQTFNVANATSFILLLIVAILLFFNGASFF